MKKYIKVIIVILAIMMLTVFVLIADIAHTSNLPAIYWRTLPVCAVLAVICLILARKKPNKKKKV